MFGLKIKPSWPKGPMLDCPLTVPHAPAAPAGAAPSLLSRKAAGGGAAAAAVGQSFCRHALRRHFLFFSSTNFVPRSFINWGRWGE